MKFKEEELSVIKELFDKLTHLYSEKANLEATKKDREETLKEDVASACKIVDKEGIPQGKKVKMPLLQAVINQLFREKPNKKDEEHDTLEIYRYAIKKEEVNKELIDGYIAIDDLLAENKENIKEAFKEDSVAILPKEIINAIDMIVKEKYKAMKDEALEKAGYEVPQPKDNSDIYEAKKAIEKVLNADK